MSETGRKPPFTGDMMKEIIGTKKVCKSGTGAVIYLDSDWGVRPGDMVQVKIKLMERGDGKHDNTGAED